MARLAGSDTFRSSWASCFGGYRRKAFMVASSLLDLDLWDTHQIVIFVSIQKLKEAL